VAVNLNESKRWTKDLDDDMFFNEISPIKNHRDFSTPRDLNYRPKEQIELDKHDSFNAGMLKGDKYANDRFERQNDEQLGFEFPKEDNQPIRN
jgi:hypothetical protein